VTRLPEVVRALCKETATPLESLDWVLAHQANERIHENVRVELGIPIEKMPKNIDRFGNTSAATLPILIDELTRTDKLKRGDLSLLLALGAGIHWGAALLQW
jgi:3-oxoacyl-[acyl-carrier-protein] synthase-3